MDGVHRPRCVEWRWCALLLSCPVQWCGSCPTHPTTVLASTAVMSCTVLCQVCGMRVVTVCLCCSCGGVSSVRSPLVVVDGGAIMDGGVPSWWWVAWWVRGGSVTDSPSNVGVPVCVLVSLFVVYHVALLNGGVCVIVLFPVFVLPCLPCVALPFLVLSSLLFCLCATFCCGWGSAVVIGVMVVMRSELFSSSSCHLFFVAPPVSCMCSLSQHCWFRVVSL